MAENWTKILAVVNKTFKGGERGGGYAQDRAMRIAKSVEKLAAEVGGARVDLAKVAALYTSAAPNMGDAAELAADQLKELLPAADLELLAKILREHRQRDTQLLEAKLLSDAVTLEEFGLVGLWNTWRQFHAVDKTLEQFLKLCKAQHDYAYWESRLRDGFHFETTRRTAKDRLGYMRGIYERLQQEQLGEDVGGNPMGRF